MPRVILAVYSPCLANGVVVAVMISVKLF